MKNIVRVDSDNVNLYVTLEVRSKPIGLIVLGAKILSVAGFLFYILSGLDGEEVGGFLIPLFFISLVFIVLPLKYLLWNLCGKENIIINTKLVQHSYDYGLIRTNPKVKHFHRLVTGYEKVRIEDGQERGKLLFYNYRNEDDLPEMIFETTILIEKEEIEAIEKQIDGLFSKELFRKNDFIGYSLN